MSAMVLALLVYIQTPPLWTSRSPNILLDATPVSCLFNCQSSYSRWRGFLLHQNFPPVSFFFARPDSLVKHSERCKPAALFYEDHFVATVAWFLEYRKFRWFFTNFLSPMVREKRSTPDIDLILVVVIEKHLIYISVKFEGHRLIHSWNIVVARLKNRNRFSKYYLGCRIFFSIQVGMFPLKIWARTWIVTQRQLRTYPIHLAVDFHGWSVKILGSRLNRSTQVAWRVIYRSFGNDHSLLRQSHPRRNYRGGEGYQSFDANENVKTQRGGSCN